MLQITTWSCEMSGAFMSQWPMTQFFAPSYRLCYWSIMKMSPWSWSEQSHLPLHMHHLPQLSQSYRVVIMTLAQPHICIMIMSVHSQTPQFSQYLIIANFYACNHSLVDVSSRLTASFMNYSLKRYQWQPFMFPIAPFHFILCVYVVRNAFLCNFHEMHLYVFHISNILYCTFILCIIVTNLTLWLQYLNKLTYLLTQL